MLRCLPTIWTLNGYGTIGRNSLICSRAIGNKGNSIERSDYLKERVPDVAEHTLVPQPSHKCCASLPAATAMSLSAGSQTSHDVALIPTGASVRRPDALTVLRAFLSHDNMCSPNPQMHTANTLKSMYTTIKARHQLRQLGPGRMSLLISLLGTLSLNAVHPRLPSIFSHPLGLRLGTQPSRSHWIFILMVVRDLERLNKVLDHSSRYWAMRAELFNVSESSDSDARTRAFDRARCHYLGFHPTIAHPDVRLPYLQMLLAFFSEYSAEVIDHFCNLLRWHDNIHPRLLAILWEVILRHGIDTPAMLKAKLLSTLRRRLAVYERRVLGTDTQRPLSQGIYPKTTGPPRDEMPFRITEYASVLTSVIFRRDPVHHPHLVYHWAASQSLAVFRPHSSTEAQWNHLELMALFNTPPSFKGSRLQIAESIVSDTSTIWRLVLSLAALEKVFGRAIVCPASYTQDLDNLKVVIRNLWNTWVLVVEQEHQPPFIHRAILGSFLRFSGLLLDASLKEDCFRLCSSHHLRTATDFGHHDALQVKHLMVEYMVASVLCGQRNWAVLFSSVDELLPQWRSEIAMLLTSRLLTHDVHVAHQVFLYFDLVGGMEIPSSEIVLLGKALASEGLFHLVLAFFRDARLSQSHFQELTVAVLRAMVRQRVQRIETDVAGAVTDAIQRAFLSSSLPPPALQRDIQHALLVVTRSNHPSKAIAIFQSICQSSPKYFRARYISIFFRQLLRLHQFRLAARLYVSLQTSHPDHLAKLRPIFILSLAEGGASSLARKFGRASAHDRCLRSRIEKSVHALDYKLKSPSLVSSLKAVAILTRPPLDGPSVRLAVQILVRVGRLLAARKLFERTRNELDSGTRTKIGNIILHGVLLRSSLCNRQQMRKLLATLDALVKKQGFVPDRVTANIILKAVLRWDHAIDTVKLHAIFDQMVNTGYQAVNSALGDSPPFGFGTPLENSSNPLHDVSFEKHIRPLYRMFIRAFYLRGDIRAAKTVVGHLKEAQDDAQEAVKGGRI